MGRGVGTAPASKGWEDALPVVRAGRGDGDPPGDGQGRSAPSLDHFPGLVSGAADLTGNTGVKLPDGAGQQTAEQPGGRQIYYGIREHAMGAALVGMAMHGGILPVGGTFFVFLDYMRPPVRLAALSRAKVVFVFSHDSVGVGEDGPTHQPVEHLATLRAIPGLQVIRPADANETAAAWRAAVDHDGPTALVLTRQGVPVCTDGSAVERGAGIVADVDGPGAGHRRHRQRGLRCAIDAAERLTADGIADACRQPAELGPLRAPRAASTATSVLPARRAGAVGRGGHDVRLGAVRRRLDRHRPLRRQRAGRRGPASASASTSTTSCSGHARS